MMITSLLKFFDLIGLLLVMVIGALWIFLVRSLIFVLLQPVTLIANTELGFEIYQS